MSPLSWNTSPIILEAVLRMAQAFIQSLAQFLHLGEDSTSNIWWHSFWLNHLWFWLRKGTRTSSPILETSSLSCFESSRVFMAVVRRFRGARGYQNLASHKHGQVVVEPPWCKFSGSNRATLAGSYCFFCMNAREKISFQGKKLGMFQYVYKYV